MCLQCLAKTRMIKEVMPGYYLVKGTVATEGWPKGWYGLVQCNDPDFVWPCRMTHNPIYEMTDKEIENCSKKMWEKNNEWWKTVEMIQKEFFSTDPMTNYEFVCACKKAGYSIRRNGKNVVAWFTNYVGKQIKRKSV